MIQFTYSYSTEIHRVGTVWLPKLTVSLVFQHSRVIQIYSPESGNYYWLCMTTVTTLESAADHNVTSENSSEESSMELSYSSSTFDGSGDEESVTPTSNDGTESEPEGVHPFLYEPSSDSDDEQGSDSSNEISPRLLNLDW